MTDTQKTKITLIAIAVLLLLNATGPFVGLLPVRVIFELTKVEGDPLLRQLLSAYLFYENQLAVQWRIALPELRFWMGVSYALALMSFWAAWLLIRLRETARPAVIIVAGLHVVVYLLGWLTALILGRGVRFDLDRFVDALIWIVCIAFMNSRAVR